MIRIVKENIVVLIDELLLTTILASLFSPHIMRYLSNYYVCFLFIIFHELSHVLIASMFLKKPSIINLSISGLSISLENKEYMEIHWIIIFLAGPLSNVLLALFFINVPIVFEINMALAIVNMLPIYPLDGYNILKNLSKWYISQEKAKQVLSITSNVSLIIIFVLSLVLIIKHMNFSLLLLTFHIFIINKDNLNSL